MALSLNNSRLSLNTGKSHGPLVEEIEGLIRVYKDGHVERPAIIPSVPCKISPELKVTARDITLDRYTNLWARIYVPQHGPGKLPLLVYFHGGGFCVGSASWSCYHDFLSNLASKAGCLIMSVNYHLAPETRLPGAYEDGFNTVMWLKHQVASRSNEHSWWLNYWEFGLGFFLGGDSAGANIAHNVSLRIGIEPSIIRPLCHKGTILIQPFFGGEVRTSSEKAPQNPYSVLSLSASDTYWRLSLPLGTNRDHPWCNPLGKGAAKLGGHAIPATMLCVSDMDILMDRNIEFYKTMVNAGKAVKMMIYKGVGHAFQILDNSPVSAGRTQEMMSHLKSFINS
ncbi:putative carboxylesterase 17 [Silene latifolia]|uniref:putative carboxylesterase 17 n=1 Tax=Silene latifolia TaxID=37657 RepID=UPI003D76C573